MNDDYTTPLLEISDTNHDNHQQVLFDCQDEIIEAFGGIDTMIELCVTNPQFSTNKYKSQFNSLKRVMESKNINFESKYNCHINHFTQSDKTNNAVILPNLGEFYKYSLGLVAYYSDSLYFMFLSTTTAKYIFNHILYTKMYPICGIISFSTLSIIAATYWYVADFDTIYYLLINTAYSIGIVVCLSYILSANISIVTLIMQTFDFWYKMYNLIVWLITAYVVYGQYIITQVFVYCHH